MLGEALNLLLLTILFTFSTVFALIIRRKLRGGAGQFMYLIWLAVMLSAVIPMQIAPPVVNLIVSERTVMEVQPPYRDMYPEIMLITDASRELHHGELPYLRANLSEAEEPIVYESGDAVAFNLSSLMLAGLHTLLFLWAVGMSYRFVQELLEYGEIKRYLQENSDPCSDRRLHEIYVRCAKKIGLRKLPPLRRISENCPITPCVIGILHPTIYFSSFCEDLDDSHLENIFTHELCHVKRRDMLYKLLMVLTISVHWFNPVSQLLRNAVAEDCEMACDATVLSKRPASAVRDYMESILTVAERVRRERRARHGQYAPIFRAAFFMANDTTPNYLKRRYLHMKTTSEKKNQKFVNTVCAGVLALIAAANVVVLSSCAYVKATDETADATYPGGETYLCDPVETAFANYFNVPAFSAITEEQLSQIDSVDVYLLTPQDGSPDTVYVSFDGGNVELLMPCIVPLDVYRDDILPAIENWDKSLGNDGFNTKKFCAFYAVKDPADPLLEPRAVAEMQALIPITKEMSVALYDPYTTAREDNLIYSIFCGAGLVNDAAFSEQALYAKLGAIPALQDAEITVHTAESVEDFDVDLGAYQSRGMSYKDYMSEYRAHLDAMHAEQAADISVQETNLQTDLNGNGIIGE